MAISMEVLNGPHKGRHVVVSSEQQFHHIDRIEPAFMVDNLSIDSLVFRDRHQVIESGGRHFLLYNGTKLIG